MLSISKSAGIVANDNKVGIFRAELGGGSKVAAIVGNSRPAVRTHVSSTKRKSMLRIIARNELEAGTVDYV
jgi:hypothetical protein